MHTYYIVAAFVDVKMIPKQQNTHTRIHTSKTIKMRKNTLKIIPMLVAWRATVVVGFCFDFDSAQHKGNKKNTKQKQHCFFHHQIVVHRVV